MERIPMGVTYIVKQTVGGQSTSFTAEDILESDLKKIISLMIGKVEVFKSSGATNTTKVEPFPAVLNTKVFSSGAKNGSVYDRDSWSIRHMAPGKGLKDVRALIGNLHASFNVTSKAKYVNLISDKKV